MATSAPKKKKIQLSFGKIHIQCTYNNTIISVATPSGDVVLWGSSGQKGFSGPKRSTPFASGVVAKDVATRAREIGLKEADIFVKGVGAGRDQAVRAISSAGINLRKIVDVTPVAHNGCRAPKARRV